MNSNDNSSQKFRTIQSAGKHFDLQEETGKHSRQKKSATIRQLLVGIRDDENSL
jgi:hypothetical protein